jgi:replicative DNA helicase
LGTWDYYAEQVLTCLTIRDADHAAQVLVQRLETVTEPQDVADIVRTAMDDLEGVTGNLVEKTNEPPVSLQELFDEPEEPYNWLVPGLWERMDRIIITGYEGTGKSYLLAQFALAAAAGIHPFAGTVFRRDGFRVLVIDCENSKKQITRRYSQVARNIGFIRDSHGLPAVDWSQQVRFVMRPEGVDMTNVQEFARIEQAIAATAPDLVVAGPLYRMHKMNINDEQAARELVDALDRLRVKYKFTLIAEAHVGHVGEATGGRKLRPTGSSLFLRWPEFGYGLRGFGDAQKEEHPSTVEMVAWRGSRDERHWPDILSHNADLLPWMPSSSYRERYLFSAKALGKAS